MLFELGPLGKIWKILELTSVLYEFTRLNDVFGLPDAAFTVDDQAEWPRITGKDSLGPFHRPTPCHPTRIFGVDFQKNFLQCTRLLRCTQFRFHCDIARKGKDLEVMVLAKAVRAHLKKQVLLHHNRTIVFE